MVGVALFVALTFAVAGFLAMTLLTESSVVVAQNETGANESAASQAGSNQTGMAPATKR
jgi:hypothetical protein